MGTRKICWQSSSLGEAAIKKLLFSVSLLVVVASGVSTAQAAKAPNGITVSPALVHLNLAKQQNSVSFNVNVTNNTNSTAFITVSAQDFTANGENGSLRFVPNGASNSSSAHGLSSFFQLGSNNLIIPPGKSQFATVTISHTNQLAPGGHFAALLFKTTGQAIAGSNSVSINQAVSTIVFVTTYGGGTQKLSVDQIPMSRIVTKIPSNLEIVFDNNGNTQTVPRGYVQVVNSSGKTVAQTIMNDDSDLLLPGNKRLFTVGVNTTGHLWPGYYHIKVFYRHDGEQHYQMYEASTYLIGSDILAGSVILLLAIVLLILELTKPKRSHKKVSESHHINS